MCEKPYPTGYDLEFVSTDHTAREAGCIWGVLLQRHGDDLWVLTNIGVRYYAFPSEHKFLRRGDYGYGLVLMCWNAGLQTTATMQRGLPPSLRAGL